MSEEQEQIEKIFAERYRHDANTKSLAHLIRSMIGDTLSGDKYLGELLQNADDAGSTDIAFMLLGRTLIFEHSGKQFDAEDVIGISDAAKPDRKKTLMDDVIGNKGIGFKSVFSMASSVTIFSQNYTFRFDEHDERWAGNPNDYPWQIIPIWTERSFHAGVLEHCHADKVQFIFNIRPEMLAEVTRHLQTLRTRNLLFLRHVKKMRVKISDSDSKDAILAEPERMCIRESASDSFKVNKLKLNETSYWCIYEVECPFPLELSTILKTPAANNVPEKYKTWSSVLIKLAVFVRDDKLVALSVGDPLPQVFCYLPTEMRWGFKFLVNAEMMLDSSRMQLSKSPVALLWNKHILTSIARHQVKFLSVLACRTNLWKGVFNILSGMELVPTEYQVACKAAYDKELIGELLVKNMLANSTRRIAQTFVDRQGYIAHFGSDEQKAETAHSHLDINLLLELKGKRFCVDQILEDMKTARFRKLIDNAEKNKEFMLFFASLYLRITDQKLKEKFVSAFKSERYVFSSNNRLLKASEIDLPNETLKFAMTGFGFVEIIHPMLSHNEEILTWLSIVGVKPIAMQRLVTLANKAEGELVGFGIVLAKNFARLTEQDQVALKQLKLQTENGRYVIPSQTYLPDTLDPKEKIEAFISAQHSLCLSRKYFEFTEEIKDALRVFFLAIGVTESVTKDNLSFIIDAVNATANIESVLAFTQYLFAHHFDLCIASSEILAKLLLVTTDRRLVNAKETYLSSVYEPAQDLEPHTDSLCYVSHDYKKSEDSAVRWKKFFVYMGAGETIKVKVFDEPYRLTLIDAQPDALEYFTFLEGQYAPLYLPATVSYMYQHRLSKGAYVHIPFSKYIYKSPIFWQLLAEHWPKFGEGIAKVEYSTARDSKEVASNIHCLVNRAVQESYGAEAKPAEYFPAGLRALLKAYAAPFTIANITASLSLEQAAVLGFRVQLTKEECLSVLVEISKHNKADDFSVIVFVYQNLVKLKVDDEEECKADLPLMNQARQFVPAHTLYYCAGDPLADSRDKHLIRKPNTLDDASFTVVCKQLGVKLIPFADLIPSMETMIESNLISLFHERAQCLLAAEAVQKDWTGDEKKTQCAQLLKVLETKLNSLTLQACNTVFHISYKDVLKVPASLWINKEAHTIYHQTTSLLDHADQSTLYDFLYEYLGLSFDKTTFISILTSSMDKLNDQYEEDIHDIDLAELKVMTVVDASEEGTQLDDQSEEDEESFEAPAAGAGAGAGTSDTLLKVRQDSRKRTAQTSRFSFYQSVDEPATKRRAGASTDASTDVVPAPVVPSLERKGGMFSEKFTKEQRKGMGDFGEHEVYEFLKAKHQKEHAGATFTETELGYILEAGESYKKEVCWLNKKSEAYQSYDFTITVNKGDKIKKRYIEVKTSSSDQREIDVTFSSQEWKLLEDCSKAEDKSYRLYRVKVKIEEGQLKRCDDPRKVNVLDEVARGVATRSDRVCLTLS